MDANARTKGRIYTTKQRTEALRLYREVGPAEAARRLDMPSPTIRFWARREGLSFAREPSEQTRAATDAARRTWAQRREDLANETGAVAGELLERIRAARKPSDVRSLATAFGVVVEKAQLLDGSPTEHVEISEDERRKRVLELRDEVAARRAKSSGALHHHQLDRDR